MDTRPTWLEYFLQLALLVSTRSTCIRRKVGAVLVRDNHIIATGYNGSPSGTPHCVDVGCIRKQMNIPSGERHEYCVGVHAEANCIAQSARYGVSIQNSVLYCTHFPCIQCLKIIMNAGVKEVHCLYDYNDPLSKDLLSKSNLIITVHKEISLHV